MMGNKQKSTMKNSPLDQIKDFILSPGKLLVVTHVNPDGDAVGSLLAMSGILDLFEMQHIVAVDDKCPDRYGFMPGFKRIRNLKKNPLKEKVDRLIVLDAGALKRIGSAEQCIAEQTKILNIDHHFTGEYYGNLNLIDIDAAATCELLFDLCVNFNLNITPQIANGIYVGLLTDTGRFRFSNTNARSLKICGDLVEKGVNPGLVAEHIYYNMPIELVKSLAHGLASLELHNDGLVCLMNLDYSDYSDEAEGFVEFASSVRGVAISALISEREQNHFKVSLRSRSRADVSVIAWRMGGGGHRKAAGFRFQGSYSELHDKLLEEIRREICTCCLKPGEEMVPLEANNGNHDQNGKQVRID